MLKSLWKRESFHEDLLFQIISQRYERGAILFGTNRAYKH